MRGKNADEYSYSHKTIFPVNKVMEVICQECNIRAINPRVRARSNACNFDFREYGLSTRYDGSFRKVHAWERNIHFKLIPHVRIQSTAE